MELKTVDKKTLIMYDELPVSEGLPINNYYISNGKFGGVVVAVKVLDAIFVTSKDDIENEVKTLRETIGSHENLVEYFCCEQMEFVYFAMELCHCSLSEWIKEMGRAKEILAQNVTISKTDIVYHITSGIAYLHSKNIVHRNLKPTNVLMQLVGGGGGGESSILRVKVSDYGLSKKALALDMSYMAPEILKQGKGKYYDINSNYKLNFSAQTDIFSLGCVSFLVLSGGKHLFEGCQYHMQCTNRLHCNHDDEMLALAQSICHQFELLKQMTAIDPNQRPAATEIMENQQFFEKREEMKTCLDGKSAEGRGGGGASEDESIVGDQDGLRCKLDTSFANTGAEPTPMEVEENGQTRWHDINSETQTEILKKVEDSLKIRIEISDLENLNAQLLSDLIHGKMDSKKIFKSTIPEQPSYYIPRKVVQRNVVSNEALKEHGDDVFVFTGVEMRVLANLVPGPTDMSNNQIKNKKLTVRFLVLELGSDFDEICKIAKTPVHWLQVEGNNYGTYTWVKSWGNLRIIQQHLAHDLHITLQEDEFLNSLESKSSTSPGGVIISANPGMGKSVMLGRIGKHLQKKFPDRIVLLIEISEFYADLKKSGNEELTLQALVAAMSRQISEYELGRKIFIQKIKSGVVRLELLVDGYDGVEKQQSDESTRHLRMIYKAFKNIRLWVTTTGPGLLEKLENTLETIGYNLQGFEQQDQIKFLVDYWSSLFHHKMKWMEKLHVEKLATRCVKNLQLHRNDKKGCEAGEVPLLCQLSGEVFADKAIECPKGFIYMFPDDIIFTNSVTDLYARVIDKRIQEYNCNHPEAILHVKQIIDTHVWFSLQLLFHECPEKLRNYFSPGLLTNGEVLKFGMLTSTGADRTLKFVHRSFAEYFAASFTVQLLKIGCWNDYLTEFICNCVLSLSITTTYKMYNNNVYTQYSFDHEGVCFFFDQLLTNFDVSTLDSNVQATFRDRFTCEEANMICRACVNGDFVNIFKLFDNMLCFEVKGKELFDEGLVYECTLKSGEGLLSLICKKFEEFQSVPVSQIRIHGKSVLHHAVKRGDYSIFNELMINHGFTKLVEDGELKFLLHECVEGTRGQDEKIIDKKIKILFSFLMMYEFNDGLLEEEDGNQCTPILCKHIHPRIIVELMETCANITAIDKDGNNLLHRLVDTLRKSQDYLKILGHFKMSMESLEQLVLQKNTDGFTPLHWLVSEFNPDEKILEKLQQAEANFNSVNLLGDTVLVTAIKRGRSLDCVKKLISLGASVELKNELVASAAAEYNKAVQDYLLKDKRSIDNNKNVDYTGI